MSPNEVFTMAGAFITSCPSTNPVLPSKAFPTLSIAETKAQPGTPATFKFDSSAVASGTKLFAVFFTGLSKIFVPLQDGKATIPKDLVGTVYVVIGTSESKADDSDIVAGPTALRFEFDSRGNVIA